MMSTPSNGDRAPDDAMLGTAALEALLGQLGEAALCALDGLGRVTYWHASARTLLGHAADDLAGHRLETLLPEEQAAEAVLTRALFAASADGRARIHAALLTRVGQRRLLMLDIHPRLIEDGDVDGFVVLMRAPRPGRVFGVEPEADDDIAGAHRANVARAGLEAAWIGIDLAVRIDRLNTAVTELLQRPAEQLTGQPLGECLQPADSLEWPMLLHRAVRDDLPLDCTLVSRGETGSRYQARLLAVRDRQARLDGFTLVFAPEAGTAPPMAAGAGDNRRWLFAAAHDLREPLRKMQGYLGALQTAEAPRLSDDGRRQIERIDDAATRMQTLVDGMLRLARAHDGALTVTDVDLSALVDEVRTDLARLIDEHGAGFEVGALPRMRGDAAQLRSLFQNLIDNSIRYRRPDAAPQISIESVPDGECVAAVALDYQDNGRGLAEPEHAFAALRSRDAGTQGTGLGLALCRRICRQHGGDIVVQASDDTGTRFRITLDEPDPDEANTT